MIWVNLQNNMLSERSLTQKNIYHMIPEYESQEQTKRTYGNRNQDSGFQWGSRLIEGDLRNFGGWCKCFIVEWVLVPWLYTFVKTQQIIYLRSVYFIIVKIHFNFRNKVNKLKKWEKDIQVLQPNLPILLLSPKSHHKRFSFSTFSPGQKMQSLLKETIIHHLYLSMYYFI